VGEDGYFYYQLTEEGKKKVENMDFSPIIKKIIKRENEED